jgi:hypothetical protein
VAAPRPGIGRLNVRDRLLTTARRVNLPLLAITVGGALFGAYWTAKVSQWAVMSDELQYSKLGLSVGETLSPIPVIRGAYTGSLAQLYPILIAPFMRLLDMPTAFRAMHVFNSALMASTAIPAYLLSLRVVRSRSAAYLVAALTVAVPWIVMSTMLLTETAGYPAFIWAILAMQRSIDRPGTVPDLLALVALAIAFLARTQFLLLAPVFALTIVLHEIGYAAIQERLRPVAAIRQGLREIYAGHRVLVWITAAGASLAIPALIAGVAGKILGRYEATVTSGDFFPPGILHSVALHLDFIALGVAVLPFVLGAAWAFGSIFRPTTKAGHAFAILSVLTVVTVVFESASFNLRFAAGGPVQDRYVFYFVPLLFIGMAACVLDTRRRSLSVVGAGILLAWLLSQTTTWGPSGLPFFASPDSVFHRVVAGRAWQVGHFAGLDLSAKTVIVIGTLMLTAASSVALKRLDPRYTLMAVGLPALIYCALETNYVFKDVVPYINHGPPTTLKGRDWVDKSTSGAKVGALVSPVNANWDGAPRWYGPGGTEAIWLDTEFWNKSIDHVYVYQRYGEYAPFKYWDLKLNYRSGRISLADAPSVFVVSGSDLRFELASYWRKDTPSGLTLIKPSMPHRAKWATRDLPPDGWTAAGKPFHLRLYPTGAARAYRVSMGFTSSPDVKGSRRFHVSIGGASYTGVLKRAKWRTATLDVCVPSRRPLDGVARVWGSTDLGWRGKVGLRITRITARPLDRPCSARG